MRPLCPLICKARPNIETTFLLCQGPEVRIHQLLDRTHDTDKVSFGGNTISLLKGPTGSRYRGGLRARIYRRQPHHGRDDDEAVQPGRAPDAVPVREADRRPA